MAGGYTLSNTNRFPIVIPEATQTSDGVMSSEDKTKLDGIAPGGDYILFNVAAGIAVGNWVYESAADTADKADASTTTKMPAVGVVVSKPTPTTAYVDAFGEQAIFGGLTATSAYYVSAATPGTITVTPPSTVGQVVQKVGIAKNATTLLQDRQPQVLL